MPPHDEVLWVGYWASVILPNFLITLSYLIAVLINVDIGRYRTNITEAIIKLTPLNLSVFRVLCVRFYDNKIMATAVNSVEVRRHESRIK